MEYLGRVTVQGVLTPSRAAYLVRPGSREGLRRAICEASTRWGGRSEPIVPVYAGRRLSPRWEQIIQVAGVDGLVNVDVELADAQRVARQLGLGLVPIDHVDDWGETKWTSHPSSVESWDSEPNPPVSALWDAPLWELASAGGAHPDHAKALAATGMNLRTPWAQPDQLARAHLGGRTLIDRTLNHFYEYAGSGGPFAFSTLVWVTRPNDFLDCLSFWNARALAPIAEPSVPVVLLPVGQSQYWQGFREQFQALLSRPDEFAPDVIMLSHSLNDATLHTEAERLGLVSSKERLRASRRFGAPARTPPFTYVVDKDPGQFLIFGRKYGLQMQAESFRESPKTVVAFDSPVRFSGHGYTRLEMRSHAFAGLPRTPEAAGMVYPNATWSEDAISIRTNTNLHFRLELSLPTLPEVCAQLLQYRVPKWELSEKGKLVSPLLRNDVLTLFRKAGTSDAIAALTTPRSKELEKQLRKLRDSGASDADLVELAHTWGGRAERRYRISTNLEHKHGLDVAERLCELGLAERGLGIRCGTCGMRSFLSIATTHPQAACPGCSAVGEYDRDGKRVAIYYRLSTLVDLASDQGSVPVLQTIATLRARSEHTHVLPGVSLTTHEGATPEVDLYGVSDGKTLAGEVKTSARQFTRNQISRDIALSALLDVQVHVMACLEPLPSDTVLEAERQCRRAGIQLMALSGGELTAG